MSPRLLPFPLLFALACQPLPEQPSGAGGTITAGVVLEPDTPLDAAASVLRAHIALPSPDAELAADVLLLSDELSDYHLGRIVKRDLPNTLVERIVPAMIWSEERTIVIAPSVPLTPGALYSIAGPELGRIATITIAETQSLPLVTRIWPPAEGGAGSARVVYCREQALALDPTPLELSPGAVAALATTELGGCLSLATEQAPQAGTRLVPPPELAGFALDPAPIEHAEHPAPGAALCEPDEVELGPGCARAEDDRLTVRSRSEASLWFVSAPALSVLETVGADASFVVRGLSPSSTITLDVVVLDLAGRAVEASATLQTSAPRPRLVLNEVLANPLGPEPQQEWVEIVNDGAIAVDLAGYRLEDVGGSSELPSALLAPGEHILVVREDFVTDDGLDVAVQPEVRLVRVPALGKNGLSNSGEPLVLRAADGAEISKFPALPKPKAGVSSARRRSFDLDDDPDAFVLHPEPGASPGAPNPLP